jgi:hypothetical protein
VTGPESHVEVYRPLLDGVAGLDLDVAPVTLTVRCGIGEKRPCGKPLGKVVSTERGLAWRPAEIRRDDRPDVEHAPGRVPMLLPVSTPEQRGYWCETLYVPCPKHETWTLSVTELVREAKSRRDVYLPKLAVPEPTDWGPAVTDPTIWSVEDVAETRQALAMLRDGEWPPDGWSHRRRSMAEGRMAVVLHLLAEMHH